MAHLPSDYAFILTAVANAGNGDEGSGFDAYVQNPTAWIAATIRVYRKQTLIGLCLLTWVMSDAVNSSFRAPFWQGKTIMQHPP